MKRRNSDETIIIFVLIIIIAGGAATLLQLNPWSKEPVEIILSGKNVPLSDTAQIYVDGAVLRPGWYPIYEDSSISDVVLSAGGMVNGTDISGIELRITTVRDSNESQKISINRADAWLIEALPGIGPTSAQRIIDYRTTNGPFVTIYELLLVPGIGQSTFDDIKGLITVE